MCVCANKLGTNPDFEVMRIQVHHLLGVVSSDPTLLTTAQMALTQVFHVVLTCSKPLHNSLVGQPVSPALDASAGAWMPANSGRGHSLSAAISGGTGP